MNGVTPKESFAIIVDIQFKNAAVSWVDVMVCRLCVVSDCRANSLNCIPDGNVDIKKQ